MKNTIRFFYFFLVILQLNCHLEKLMSPNSNSDADFTFELADHQGYAPCKVEFQNLSDNAITYEWNFGDAMTSTQPSPSHTYVKPGDYTVTLTITDSEGNQESLSKPVTIKIITFSKFVGNGSYTIHDILETNKREFWVTGAAYDATDVVGYLLTSDEWGTALQEFKDNSFDDLILGFPDSLDFTTRLGNGPNGPYVWAFQPPDLFIGHPIPTMERMVDGIVLPNNSWVIAGDGAQQIIVKYQGTATSPGWEKLIGLDKTTVNNLIATSDGGIAVVGTRFNSANNQRTLFVCKLTATGTVQWTYNSFTTSILQWDIAQTKDENFMVCGGSGLLKISAAGSKIWDKTYNEGTFLGIAPTLDNGVVITGNNGASKTSLVKIDNNGIKVWNRIYDSPGIYDEGRVVKPTSDCGFIVLSSSGGGWDESPFLIKTDADGYVY